MKLEDLLRNRSLMLKIFWLGFIASLVFIAVGAIYILLALT